MNILFKTIFMHQRVGNENIWYDFIFRITERNFGLVSFGCLGFMAYQPLKVIQCQIHFYTNRQFYFKLFSLARVQFNSQKHFYFKLFSLVKEF